MKSSVTVLHLVLSFLMTGFAAITSGCAAPDAGDAELDDGDEDPSTDDGEPELEEMVACYDEASCNGGGSGSGSGSGSVVPYLRMALKASNGQYVVAEGGGGGVVNANRSVASTWETFRLIPLGGANFALQASNGQYVVAEGGGGGEVNANRGAIGPWETFTMVNVTGGKTVFRTTGAWSYYLMAMGGGGGDVYAYTTNWGPWESFTMVDMQTAPLTHSMCSTGSALKGEMGSCVTKVCVSFPHCCSTSWDSTCVTAVTNICGQSC